MLCCQSVGIVNLWRLGVCTYTPIHLYKPYALCRSITLYFYGGLSALPTTHIATMMDSCVARYAGFQNVQGSSIGPSVMLQSTDCYGCPQLKVCGG